VAVDSSFQWFDKLACLVWQPYQWMTQTLDHFNAQDTRTWQQRYFVNDTFWSAPDGPVILFICGEGTCTGVPSTRQFPMEVAKTINALVLTLEHRFYG